MSRSGYSDDCDNWDLIRWRGRVASSIRGNRGQKFLQDLLVALDAMPVKRLIAEDLERDGEVCAIGSLAQSRNVDLSTLEPTDREAVAEAFNIAMPLAAEVAYQNDEGGWQETPEGRWTRMRSWVASQIKQEPST